jgi:dienelactone hydrolase
MRAVLWYTDQVVDLNELRVKTRRAYLRLAAVVGDGFGIARPVAGNRATGRASSSALRSIGAVLVGVLLVAGLASCGGSSAAQHFTVAQRVVTFTDPSRPTPANQGVPGHSGRILVTTIYYPTTGGPFPLIVFAPGFNSVGTDYQALLSAWAAHGYVVAAPTFPLSSSAASGAPGISDFFEQPLDLSFVITAMTKLQGDRVDARHVGVAGHSLGGVTVLGLTNNTCCRDPRVMAAVAMAGDTVSFPSGAYTNERTPPLLLLHGDQDQIVPYQGSRAAFSMGAPPKFLVTLLGDDHNGPFLDPSTAFQTVVATTLDFFDIYLKDKRNELGHIQRDGDVARVAQEEQVLSGPPATATKSSTGFGGFGSAVQPSNPSGRSVTAAPDSALRDGQQIQVSWRGFTPGSFLNILECTANATGPPDCDLTHALLLQNAGSGTGSLPFTVHQGPIGRGRCDAANSCLLIVNESGIQAGGPTVATIIKFSSATAP